MVNAWRNTDAHTDDQGKTDTRSSQVYSDLDLFFSKSNKTKDVNKLTNVTAVKRSVRNLVLMNEFEKPFHPEISSGVRDTLFENLTPVTAIILSRQVQDVIENFEPRARLVGVKAYPDLDRNAYDVSALSSGKRNL